MTIFKWLWWFPVLEASLLFTRSNLVYSKWNVEWCRYPKKINLAIFAIYPNNFLLLCDVDTVWEVYELGTSCVLLTICPDFYFSKIPPSFEVTSNISCPLWHVYFALNISQHVCYAGVRKFVMQPSAGGKPHWGPFLF